MDKVTFDSGINEIIDISKNFGAKKILLFGSCLENINMAHDIDIAVSGIPPRKFFEYYAEVSIAVKENVDIVDLDDMKSYFRGCISREGKILYER